MKESDLFIYLKDYFKCNPDNEIFTEVVGICGGRPDIVVRNKKLITIIEMKTSLSMDLLEQALNWRYIAHYVYIAIPKPKHNINRFALRILKDYGIGILQIEVPSKWEMEYIESGENEYRFYVNEKQKPKLFRTSKQIIDWNKVLKDIYRCENNIDAGVRGGGYNTPYKEMIDDVKRYIYRNNNAPIPIKELIEHLEIVRLHYSNPKAGLYGALTKIEHKDFETEMIGKQIYFRLKEEAYENFLRR